MWQQWQCRVSIAALNRRNCAFALETRVVLRAGVVASMDNELCCRVVSVVNSTALRRRRRDVRRLALRTLWSTRTSRHASTTTTPLLITQNYVDLLKVAAIGSVALMALSVFAPPTCRPFNASGHSARALPTASIICRRASRVPPHLSASCVSSAACVNQNKFATLDRFACRDDASVLSTKPSFKAFV